MGAKKQTIGFHYLFDILFGIGRGPMNELRAIKVADKIAWEGNLCGPGVQAINKPDLFGGEKKEGGIQGPFRVFFGAADQVLPGAGSANCGSKGPMKGIRTLPDVKTAIGGQVSEFRGTTMLWYSGLVSSMNPYPKQWSFRYRRYSAGWDGECWYPAKAAIFMAEGKVHAMNPAHIIYECWTNRSWGRGMSRGFVDENAMTYAANTLCSEGFGLCMWWTRKESLDAFIKNVLEHIGATQYQDPETGLMVLKLNRNDYDPDDLPLFTPTTGLLDITDDDSASQDDAANEIMGTGRDPITNLDFQLRVYNNGARQAQGASNPEEKKYPGIPTRDLLLRALQRDLKIQASGLKKFNVVLDRRAYRIRPGMCFCIQDTRRGLGTVILRAGEITDVSSKDGRITIKAMQDVYGLPETSFVTPVESTWTPPATEAVPATVQRMMEANYRDMVIREDPSVIAALDPTDSFIGVTALSPDPVMYEYSLASRAVGEPDFEDEITGSFTGAATIVDPIGPYDTTFEITGETDFSETLEGQVVLIDDEQMVLIDYDPVTHMVTVGRGVADTIPEAHLAAATLWTVDDDMIGDKRAYVTGETVETAVLTRTSSDVLDIADATIMSIDMTGRQGRPYAPGDVRVDGLPALTLPTDEHNEPEVTWAHRDRILQADQTVNHEEASVGPEDGVTYNVRVYDAVAPTVAIRTETAIAGTSWTYLGTDQVADGSPLAVWVELESERDGYASHRFYRFKVYLVTGYGVGYGLNYGGI